MACDTIRKRAFAALEKQWGFETGELATVYKLAYENSKVTEQMGYRPPGDVQQQFIEAGNLSLWREFSKVGVDEIPVHSRDGTRKIPAKRAAQAAYQAVGAAINTRRIQQELNQGRSPKEVQTHSYDGYVSQGVASSLPSEDDPYVAARRRAHQQLQSRPRTPASRNWGKMLTKAEQIVNNGGVSQSQDNPNLYYVRSTTDLVYEVRLRPDGTSSCNCRWCHMHPNSQCSHQIAVTEIERARYGKPSQPATVTQQDYRGWS
jgi:hypothetical protein